VKDCHQLQENQESLLQNDRHPRMLLSGIQPLQAVPKWIPAKSLPERRLFLFLQEAQE
jgi:hypothetical protein